VRCREPLQRSLNEVRNPKKFRSGEKWSPAPAGRAGRETRPRGPRRGRNRAGRETRPRGPRRGRDAPDGRPAVPAAGGTHSGGRPTAPKGRGTGRSGRGRNPDFGRIPSARVSTRDRAGELDTRPPSREGPDRAPSGTPRPAGTAGPPGAGALGARAGRGPRPRVGGRSRPPANERSGPCPGPERAETRPDWPVFSPRERGRVETPVRPPGRPAVVPMREMAYPPQLLLRALTGPDEGLDE